MAVSGTSVQQKDNFGLLIIQCVGLTGVGNNVPPFQSQGYPYGSAHLVLVSGTATGDTVNVRGSNDGVNYSKISSFTAASANNLLPLAVGTIDAPARFYDFQIDPASTGSGNYSITVVLMGTRG